jgi:ABC-type oligopeptide transport system substrate-binding subunit
LYVAVRSSGPAHRGGQLTVANRGKIGPEAASIDPSWGYGAWELLILTNDGLTTLKRAGGSEGSRLVADLATSLPTRTDGGRTYTFQLRPGILYSNGAPVRPADFGRGIERTLVNAGRICCFPRSYFAGIIGAAACLKTKARDRSLTITAPCSSGRPSSASRGGFPRRVARPRRADPTRAPGSRPLGVLDPRKSEFCLKY